VIYSILNEHPEPVTASRREVPVSLEDVVERALTKDPAKRFQSVDEMLTALEMVQEESRLGIERRGRAAYKRLARRKGLLVGLAAVVVIVIAVVLVTSFFESSQALDSLAVMPLENLTGDESQNVFVDAVTAELITHFSRLSGVEKVSSRLSSMRYKNTDKSPREIANELDVKAVVAGMIEIEGDNIKITAELIRGDTEEQIWSDTFNGRTVEILKLQGQIARKIVDEIHIPLTPEEEATLKIEREVDPEVLTLTLMGHENIETWDGEGWDKAVENFQQAISIDSTYAPAYAGLGIVYTNKARYGYSKHKHENRRKATGAALKAIELDENSADAHTALARVYLDMNFNWEVAEKEHKRAVELDPSVNSLAGYVYFLLWAGRFTECIALQHRVIELDPHSDWQALQLGLAFLNSRRYDEAIAQYLSILESSPDYAWAKLQLTWAYMYTGKYEKADSLRIDLGMQFDAAELALMGRAEEALARVARWDSLGISKRTSYYRASIYASLGDKEKALEALEDAFEYDPETLLQINTDAEFDILRPDPRFQALMRRAGIPSGDLAHLEKQ
jgi:TolB-like protein/tetratricopeptide (TPR) repeat protein